jgi:hypothetical protein
MEDELERLCALCGAPTARLGTTTLQGGRSGVEVEVRGIPAYLCDTCKDAGIPGPLASALSNAIEQILRSVEEYNAISRESRAKV